MVHQRLSRFAGAWLAGCTLLLWALAPGASAQVTLYVDAASGSDSNDGRSPASALATLTAALGRLGSGGTLEIAAGTYAPSRGETFPATLFADGHIKLRGAGIGATLLNAQGADGALILGADSVEIEDLTLANSTGQGITVVSARQFLLRRVELRGHDVGLNVTSAGHLTWTTIENSKFEANNDALRYQREASHPDDAPLRIRGTVFEGNGAAVVLSDVGSGGLPRLDVDRCRFRGGEIGIMLEPRSLPIRLTNSAFAHVGAAVLGGAGGEIANSSFSDSVYAVLEYSGQIVNSILWGNGAEIGGSTGVVSFSIVENLELGGMVDGGDNRSADPLLDANLRLQPGSPAIDQGSNAAALALGIAGGSDIDGDARSQDAPAADGPAGFIDLGADEAPGGLDRDGDAVPDLEDNCPVAPNPLQLNTDGNSLGDACECGDQTGDGWVNVLDLVAINLAIFDPRLATPLCDTNADDQCDVLDLLGANARIFGQPAYCARGAYAH
jgi:hypothetical protein